MDGNSKDYVETAHVDLSGHEESELRKSSGLETRLCLCNCSMTVIKEKKRGGNKTCTNTFTLQQT